MEITDVLEYLYKNDQPELAKVVLELQDKNKQPHITHICNHTCSHHHTYIPSQPYRYIGPWMGVGPSITLTSGGSTSANKYAEVLA